MRRPLAHLHVQAVGRRAAWFLASNIASSTSVGRAWHLEQRPSCDELARMCRTSCTSLVRCIRRSERESRNISSLSEGFPCSLFKPTSTRNSAQKRGRSMVFVSGGGPDGFSTTPPHVARGIDDQLLGSISFPMKYRWERGGIDGCGNVVRIRGDDHSTVHAHLSTHKRSKCAPAGARWCRWWKKRRRKR